MIPTSSHNSSTQSRTIQNNFRALPFTPLAVTAGRVLSDHLPLEYNYSGSRAYLGGFAEENGPTLARDDITLPLPHSVGTGISPP